MVHTTGIYPGFRSVRWERFYFPRDGLLGHRSVLPRPPPPPHPPPPALNSPEPFYTPGGKGHCEIKVSCPRTQRSDLAGLRFELVRLDQDSSALTMGNRASHLHTHHQTCSQFLPKFNEKWCQSLRLLEITRRLLLSNAPQNFKRLCEDSENLLRIFQKTLGVLTI